MLEIVFFLILAAIPFVGLLCWLDWLIKQSQLNEKRKERRGFEVKLTTGEPPVPQNKK